MTIVLLVFLSTNFVMREFEILGFLVSKKEEKNGEKLLTKPFANFSNRTEKAEAGL